jgi:hypothetical protein
MKRYGLYDISTATNIVMLGKILDFELPIEAAKDETFFYQAVADYRQKKLEKNPFRFMEHVDILSEEKLPLIIKLKDFDRKVILPNLSTYLWRSVCQIPGALLDTSEKIILLPPKTSLTADFFRGLFLFYKYLQYLFFLTAIFAPLSFYQFLQKPNFQSAFLSILATISLYQIVFSVFFGYAEFGRLISPAQPVMYLFSFYWLGKMGKLIKASIRA